MRMHPQGKMRRRRDGAASGGHVFRSAAFHSGGLLPQASLSLAAPSRPAILGRYSGRGRTRAPQGHRAGPHCLPSRPWARIRAPVRDGQSVRDLEGAGRFVTRHAASDAGLPPVQTTGTPPLETGGGRLGADAGGEEVWIGISTRCPRVRRGLIKIAMRNPITLKRR